MLTANELLDAELAAQRRQHRDRVLERLLDEVKDYPGHIAELRQELRDELDNIGDERCPHCEQYRSLLREVGFDV